MSDIVLFFFLFLWGFVLIGVFFTFYHMMKKKEKKSPIENLVKLYSDGKIDAETYTRRKKELDKMKKNGWISLSNDSSQACVVIDPADNANNHKLPSR